MEQQELLQQIEMYRREDGSYDVRKMEKDFGVAMSIDDTFHMMMNGSNPAHENDPRLKLAVEVNGRIYDASKAAERVATRDALVRFQAGTATIKDARLLERSNLVIAEYRDADSERPTGFRLKDNRDIDGDSYADQAGLEENPGRL